MDTYTEKLLALLKPVTTDDGMKWLEASCNKLLNSTDTENDLCTFSAMAMRKLGHSPLGDKVGALETPHGALQMATWIAGNVGRVILILEAVHACPDETTQLINSAFRNGDEVERAAIISALVLFPDPGALKSIALEAGRINSLFLYTALTVNNPYAATFYDQHEFNQLIMKALFLGINIETVYGLSQRTNPELSRMCEDYIDERMDAKRTVPADIWLAALAFIGPRGKQQMALFQDQDPRHREYISRATK